MRRHRRQQSRLQLHLTAIVVVVGLGLFYGCDGGDEGEPAGLCNPGENIFCRCPGGAPGTKACAPSGDDFGECAPCDDRPSSGPGVGGYGDGGYAWGGFGVGGDGGVVTGDTPLLEACESGDECQTGLCVSSFCTRPCATVSQCPYPDSECVPRGDQALCMPTCQTAGDCAPFSAPPSACGYAQAIDNWDVTVCFDWGDEHQLMPELTDCNEFDHTACNLGYQERELVCNEQGLCVTGCFVNADCPASQKCSGQSGSFGQCQ